MIELKPYGAFIENTVRPLLKEVRDLLDENNMDSEAWMTVIKTAAFHHTLNTIIGRFFETLSIGMVVWFLWKTVA